MYFERYRWRAIIAHKRQRTCKQLILSTFLASLSKCQQPLQFTNSEVRDESLQRHHINTFIKQATITNNHNLRTCSYLGPLQVRNFLSDSINSTRRLVTTRPANEWNFQCPHSSTECLCDYARSRASRFIKIASCQRLGKMPTHIKSGYTFNSSVERLSLFFDISKQFNKNF